MVASNRAFLILAHDQPYHLYRLCRALAPIGHCYVHFDPSSGVCPRLPAGTTVLPHPIVVNHGGFSLTRAMLMLLEYALADAGSSATFTYLSGRDYPIKTNREIAEFLSANRSRNFMNFYELAPGSAFHHHISKFYFVDQRRGLPAPFRGPAFHAERVLRRLVPRRPFPLGHRVYRGSQWMTLTRSSAEHIVRFRHTEEGMEYERYFRHSWGSDEMYFQTVLLNSAEATRCMGFEGGTPSDNENKVYLHYVDWDPKRERPALLDMRDLEPLLASQYLFARKFDERRSGDLLARLDVERS